MWCGVVIRSSCACHTRHCAQMAKHLITHFKLRSQLVHPIVTSMRPICGVVSITADMRETHYMQIRHEASVGLDHMTGYPVSVSFFVECSPFWPFSRSHTCRSGRANYKPRRRCSGSRFSVISAPGIAANYVTFCFDTLAPMSRSADQRTYWAQGHDLGRCHSYVTSHHVSPV